MKKVIIVLILLLMVQFVSACDNSDNNVQLPEFDEARILNTVNSGYWTIKIESYEIIDSMFLIYGTEGHVVLFDKTNCVLYTYK